MKVRFKYAYANGVKELMENKQYIVQIPAEASIDSEAVALRLKEYGIEMDRDYGLIHLPAAEPQMIGRAIGKPEDVARCQSETSWQFFGDIGFTTVRN